MATKKIKAYTVDKNWKIYIFTFPNSNNIYVDCTSQKNLRTAYKDHNMLKFGLTKPYFEEAKLNNIKPEMYLLEEYISTKNIAYSRMVAWGKVLTDMGFYCVNGDTFRSYIEDLIDRTQSFYDEISTVNVEELISPEKNLVADYKPRKRNKDDDSDSTVHLFFTPEENKIITKRAAELELNKTTYCKQMALYGEVVTIDYSVSDEYLNAIQEGISTMQQAILTIHKLGQYFPTDLAKIEDFKNLVINQSSILIKESAKVNNKLTRLYRARQRNFESYLEENGDTYDSEDMAY